MEREHVLAYLNRGKTVVAEQQATAPERSAWVAVYPLNPARETTRELLERAGFTSVSSEDTGYYRIRAFEIDRSLQDTMSFGEPDLRNKADHVVRGDDALFAKLAELGVSTEMLEAAWKTEYPL